MFRGILKTWDDEKGYGFIRQESQSRDIFIHISALRGASRRPMVGDRLIFQLMEDDPDRPRAVNAVIEGVEVVSHPSGRWTLSPRPATSKSPRPARSSGPPHARRDRRQNSMKRYRRGVWLLPMLASLLGLMVYQEFGQRPGWPARNTLAPELSATVIEPSPAFRCEGKTRCTQMVSCEEALFYLRNCPGTVTDGDNDGIPCEDQHCGHH